jgi:hypothetical protein
MDTTSQVEHAHRNTVPLWLKISLIGLLIEKFIQHTSDGGAMHCRVCKALRVACAPV